MTETTAMPGTLGGKSGTHSNTGHRHTIGLHTVGVCCYSKCLYCQGRKWPICCKSVTFDSEMRVCFVLNLKAGWWSNMLEIRSILYVCKICSEMGADSGCAPGFVYTILMSA